MWISNYWLGAVLVVVMLMVPQQGRCGDDNKQIPLPIPPPDLLLLEFALNLEYLEAEFFSWGAFGAGLDTLDPILAKGGPPPIGPTKAFLSPLIQDLIAQFALQEFGHLRAIEKTILVGFPRPLLDLSEETFASIMDDAFGEPLHPPFNPYANDINYLLASYVIPYVGLTGYVGANQMLQNQRARKLVAGLLGVESGQDAVIRTLLYERAFVMVYPYGITVGEFTEKISKLRNDLGNKGKVKDEGLIIDQGKTSSAGNVLSANKDSLSYGRIPPEILRIVYGTGKTNRPGGFFPKGASGIIATALLTKP